MSFWLSLLHGKLFTGKCHDSHGKSLEIFWNKQFEISLTGITILQTRRMICWLHDSLRTSAKQQVQCGCSWDEENSTRKKTTGFPYDLSAKMLPNCFKQTFRLREKKGHVGIVKSMSLLHWLVPKTQITGRCWMQCRRKNHVSDVEEQPRENTGLAREPRISALIYQACAHAQASRGLQLPDIICTRLAPVRRGNCSRRRSVLLRMAGVGAAKLPT